MAGPQTSNRQLNKRTVTSSRPSQTSGISADVHRAVQSELKKYIEPKVTHVNFGAQVSGNGTIVSLTDNMTQGDSALNHYTGNLIKPQSLTLRLNVSTNQDWNVVRYIVFRWIDSSVPAPTGILDQCGTGWAPHSDFFWVNRKKIIVLKDKTMALFARVSGQYDVKKSVIRINLSSQPTIQMPSGTSGATPQNNGLYVMMITDDLITTAPAFVWRSSLVYTDA